MGKHLFATYRSYAPKAERNLVKGGGWPLGIHATNFYTDNNETILKFQEYQKDKTYLDAFLLNLNDLVC